MTRNIEAQHLRQQILDLLNENGKMTTSQLVKMCDIKFLQWPLSWMVTNREIFRSDERPAYYTVLADVTMSAADVQKQRAIMVNSHIDNKVTLADNHRIVNLLDKPARDNTGQRSRVGRFAYSGMYAQQF
jgi:hypothetical protein